MNALEQALRKKGFKNSCDAHEGWLYMDLQFSYPRRLPHGDGPPCRSIHSGGVHVSFATNEEVEVNALLMAEKCVDKALTLACANNGWEYAHAYSYPDGSLYQYVRVPFDESRTEAKVYEEVQHEVGSLVRSLSLHEVSQGQEDDPRGIDPEWVIDVVKVFPVDPSDKVNNLDNKSWHGSSNV